MKDMLRRSLTPDDDGRAFTEAVMLRASGALHRRRQAAAAGEEPVLGLLAQWARPWLVAALVVLACAALFPVWSPDSRTPIAFAVGGSDPVSSLLPTDVAFAASGVNPE